MPAGYRVTRPVWQSCSCEAYGTGVQATGVEQIAYVHSGIGRGGPQGTRGRIRGAPYEVAGDQTAEVTGIIGDGRVNGADQGFGVRPVPQPSRGALNLPGHGDDVRRFAAFDEIDEC